MRSTRLLALVLAIVPAALGCGDDIKFPDPIVPAAAINGVFPAEGFAGRTLRVQVSGDNAVFTEEATVSFSGSGITVDSLELASTSDLIATITISPDAPLGLRDVVVEDRDITLTLAQSFDVENSLIVVADSSLQQGGIGFLRIVNRDPDAPFLGDLEITGGTNTAIFVESFTANEISALVLLDTDAASSPVVVVDTLGTSVVTSRGGDLEVEARGGIALTPPGKGTGLQGVGTLNDPTLLFSFPATAGLQRARGVNTSFDNFPPQMVWLVGGRWETARFMGFDSIGFFEDEDDQLDEAQGLIPTGNEQMFVVVFDPDFILGDNYRVAVDQFVDLPNVTTLAEVEPNDPTDTPPGTAQVLPGAQTLFTGTLANFDDFDVLRVTLTAGQSIRVTSTTGPLGLADTDIAVFEDLGGGQFAFVTGFDDENIVELGEDVFTGPQPAGNYVVVIAASLFADPLNDAYEAAIVIGDAQQ